MSTQPIRRIASLPIDVAKKLPFNLDAERHVLGAILMDPARLTLAREHLTGADFYTMSELAWSNHGRIFGAMVSCANEGKPIEIVSLVEHLQADNELAAVIASLADGMPRVTDIGYYVRVIKEKARLRQIIRTAHEVSELACDPQIKADDLCNRLELFSKQSAVPTENPMVVVGACELLTLDFPPPEMIMNPLLTVGGSMMIYSWTGVGKSFITTEIAAHIALGLPTMFCDRQGRGGVWPIGKAHRVLYLYGEMHGGEIKKRWQEIAKGHGFDKIPGDDQLGFACKEYQRIKRAPKSAYDWRPSIATPTDRRIVEDTAARGGYKVLILDNISTLWPSSQEASSDREAILKNWAIDLNQDGISLIVLQHAGKNGDFLGDSSQIHILDSVLRLKKPANYRRHEQLRAEVKIEKLRHECRDSRLVQEFEVMLQTSSLDGAEWTMRPVKTAQMQEAFKNFKDGMKPGEVFMDIGISRATAFRWKKMYDDNSDSAHWSERNDD